MLRPLVRNTRFLFSLCLALGAVGAFAFVPLPAQPPAAPTSVTAPSSAAPPGAQDDHALSYPEEQRSDDSQRKSVNAAPRPAERQSLQRQTDGALPSPGTQEEKEEKEEEEEDDPDLPGFLRGRVKIDKEEYLRQRSEYIGMMRGFGDDPLHVKRSEALQQMAQQLQMQKMQSESTAAVPLSSSSVWKAVGPAPIPNGQTTDRSDPVSGRAISIAIHPTNPNIVYVGTAQGGLYRSLDGGANWTPLMDTAQSLTIGALALAPSNPSILYVGTGENGLSADSFFGVGLYRIDNADTNATLFGPIDPSVATGIAGTTAFTGRAISEILVHPTDPATIFVATAAGTSSNPSNLGFTTTPPLALRGVYRSTNATSSSPTFTKLTVTGANSVAPDTTGDRDIMDIAMEPGNPNVVLAWVGGTTPFAPPADSVTGIYRTTDALGDAGFTQTLTSTLAGVRGELAVNKIGNTVNVVVATGEAGSGTLCSTGNGAIRTSSDGGATWSGKKPGGGGFCANQCFYDIAVELHPTDPNTILLGGSAPGNCSFDFARSTDGAASDFIRTNTGLHADTHALAISPSSPNVVYIGNDGGIWKSTDTGQTWTSLNNSGFNATQFQDMALHPLDREFMIGGTQDNGTEFRQANGVWKRADFGDGGHALIDQGATDTTNVTMYHTYFNQTNSLIGFAKITNSGCANDGQWSFRGSVLFATDGTPNCALTPSEPGISSNGISASDAVRFYPPMALGPGTPNSVYFGTDKLYRDGATRGDSMAVVSQDLGDANNVITSIAVSRLDDNVRVIGTFDGKVFATTNGDNPMTNVTDTAEFPGPVFGVRRAVTDIAIDPNNSNIAYIAFGGYEVAPARHIFKTTDLNATLANPALWTPSGSGIPDVPVDALVIDPANSNIVYAGTDIGVYISTDAGANWTPFSTGLPRVAVFDLEIQAAHRLLRAVTHGRGMWEIELVGDLPGISDIPDQVTNKNTPDTTPFAVGSATGDADALLLSATVFNPALASVSFSGTGNDRTMLITPAANQSGTTEITVTVTEGARSNSDSFFLTITPNNPINPANAAPTANNDTISNVAEDSGPNATAFSALTGNDSKGPANESGQNLIVKTVGNAVGGTVSILGSNVSFTPTANYNGPASFQYTVEDDGTPPLQSTAAASVSFNVTPVADTPSVTNATTNRNSQSTTGLVITRNVADGPEVTHFKITSITGGTLFQHDGTTPINNGDFITAAQGAAGLRFTPTVNASASGGFQVQASLSNSNAGLGGDTTTATINIIGPSVQLDNLSYSAGEATGHFTITVNRAGDISGAASVDYKTSDVSGLTNCDIVTGNASSRCDYTAMSGTLNFIAGQSSASFDIPIIDDVYVEGPETFTLTLRNLTGGGNLGAPASATLTITNNDLSPGGANPIGVDTFFIREQYLDILNREPDPPGLFGWQAFLNTCPAASTACDRIELSSRFFRSDEFFARAYYIYRFYNTALGRKPSYDEYQDDFKQVAGFLTDVELEARKAAFAEEFSQRPEFKARYDSKANGDEYVNAIVATAGVLPSNRTDVAIRQGALLITRGRALRELVESPEISARFFNEAFVVIGYFAYLRREPDAQYLVWLNILNTTGDYREMIRNFIESQEYRQRFGQ